MAIALLLTAVGIVGRLVSIEFETWNLVPMGAIALYAGARVKAPWSYLAPLAAWIATDLVIDLYIFPGFARGVFDPVRLSVYGWVLAMVALGTLPRFDAHPATRAALALVASCTFFLASNFAEWAGGMVGYPKTAEGLMACYAAAVPFFDKTIIADLVGTGVLFGVDALVRHSYASRKAVELAGDAN
jgi:hypothetical protein